MNYNILLVSFFLSVGIFSCQAQSQKAATGPEPGAYQMDRYLPLLQDKRVALVVNQTSMVNDSHLVDTLLARDITITNVFAPEHGFRGEADAGEKIKDSVDPQTGLPIISLYGSNKKPAPEQLNNVDVVLFDIQDVGTRFYTYISTMHYMMEACAENNKQLIILDRPNPNGDYVDGPLLEAEHQSFVGMHPIPVVHGLTVGELAGMINGEGWLKGGIQCDVEVVTVKDYTHDTPYPLPVRPSPNLPNDQSIQLYPSLCFFEGTVMSIGRGTYFPFQVIGYPNEDFGPFSFTPKSIDGMAKSPKLEGKKCYGVDLRNIETGRGMNLEYLIDFYNKYTTATKDKQKSFFTSFFTLLAGTEKLQQQIEAGLSEEEIRKSWESDLTAYKDMRKKYLLYPDFE